MQILYAYTGKLKIKETKPEDGACNYTVWTPNPGLGQNCLQIFPEGEMQIRLACRSFHKDKHFPTSLHLS